MADAKTYGPDNTLHHFIMADGAIRGALVSATGLVREIRQAHDLGILETLVLGHACLGVALLVANLKGKDSLSLQIDCSGPIKGLVAEARADGSVRGYLKQVPIPLDKPLESFNLSPFFGAGFLTITRYLEDAKQPFSGKVVLQYGNIAEDLAHYFLMSEQNPTSFTLSVQFNPEGQVTGAGGLFLQAMPHADDELTGTLQSMVPSLPSLGAFVADGGDPALLLQENFKSMQPEILAATAIRFRCRCTREILRSILMGLPVAELDDIVEKGPFPMETRCHFCSRIYSFDRKEMIAIRDYHLKIH